MNERHMDILRRAGMLDKLTHGERLDYLEALDKAKQARGEHREPPPEQVLVFANPTTQLATLEALNEADEPYRSNIGTELLDLFDSYGIEQSSTALAADLVACSYLAATVDLSGSQANDEQHLWADTQQRHRAATAAVANAALLASDIEIGELQ